MCVLGSCFCSYAGRVFVQDASQRVTDPGMHEGRASGLADMAQVLHYQGRCPSDHGTDFPGTAKGLAGLLHTLEAATASVTAEG